MSSEVLVKVENVSKKFCLNLKRSLWYGMQDIGTELLGRKNERVLRAQEFWAVKDISFELKRGECLGLIGPNGAGKSTLLKMLNGLIKPDQGRIEINGRVSALIELGTGFNPILTGRENIYVNAAVLGLSREEVDAKLTNIIEFAEIGDFIDTPVQSYSSGMKVRLGFAVAAQMEPDVLIIDEVLAVGDVGFRNKCYTAIDQIMSDAVVILVTHNMEAMTRMSNRSIVMKTGQVIYDGIPVEASVKYTDVFQQETQLLIQEGNQLNSLNIYGVDGNHIINFGEDIWIEINLESKYAYKTLLLKVNFTNSAGAIAAEYSNLNNNHIVNLNPGKNHIKIQLKELHLRPQKYYVSFTLIQNRSNHIFWCRNVETIYINGHQQGHQNYQLTDVNFSIANH